MIYNIYIYNMFHGHGSWGNFDLSTIFKETDLFPQIGETYLSF